jgi:hypothetical protein
MATTAEQVTGQPNRRPKKRATDPFGGGIPMALVALAVTGIGFWRTFFSQLQHVSGPHLIHGGLSVAWLALVLVQATLIRRGEYKWHRVLGWSSLLLFAALVATSWWMVALMLSPSNPLPFQLGKLFAYSDLATLPLLIILYGGAIALRKDRHIHSRLVSATMLVAIVPAVARMFNLLKPGMDGLVLAMHPTYWFVLAILAIAMFVDWGNGRLRWPFPFAFIWFAITYATLFPAWHSHWFDTLAHSIAAAA